MGNESSTAAEKPPDAVLYYFGGRGMADQVHTLIPSTCFCAKSDRPIQIRWLLAASRIHFGQVVIDTRAKFLELREKSLIFGQMPMVSPIRN